MTKKEEAIKRPPLSADAAEGQIVLYHAADGRVTVNVLFGEEDFWLTQRAMSELFGVQSPAVNKHLKNIFATGELEEDSVVSILEIAGADGKKYKTRFYNADRVARSSTSKRRGLADAAETVPETA
jgi:hypothetical protein